MTRQPSAWDVEALAWQRVVAARAQLMKALAEHQTAADRAMADAAGLMFEGARTLRNFRALLPYTRPSAGPQIPAPQIPAPRAPDAPTGL